MHRSDEKVLNETTRYPENRKVMSHESAVKVAETEQGRKYGYSLKNPDLPKMLGNLSAGLARDPPTSGLGGCLAQKDGHTVNEDNKPHCRTNVPSK